MSDNNIFEQYEIEITSLTQYLEQLKRVKQCIDQKTGENKDDIQFYFRGQNRLWNTTLPGVFRENFLENEENLFRDFLIKDPILFNVYSDGNTNFDKLALMQHHGLPTRLLDITRNPLFALYFAVSGGTNKGKKISKDDKTNVSDKGEVYLFFDHINKKLLKQSEIHNSIEKEFGKKASKRPVYETMKSAFSDQIELESSMVRLPLSDKKFFLDAVQTFLKDNGDSEMAREAFNANHSVKKLYHEVRRDIHDFTHDIEPFLFTLPNIVAPRVIDERIKNQQGMFIFVPFVKSEDVEKETQNLINLLRPTVESKMPKFTIPDKYKDDILKELAECGITEDFVYPDHLHIANSVKSRYK